jgi:hypothetical protein
LVFTVYLSGIYTKVTPFSRPSIALNVIDFYISSTLLPLCPLVGLKTNPCFGSARGIDEGEIVVDLMDGR